MGSCENATYYLSVIAEENQNGKLVT